MSGETTITVFDDHADDEGFHRWRVEHRDGFVLTRFTRGAGYSLHDSECYHLGPFKSARVIATKKPKYCSMSADLLRDKAQRDTGSPPNECAACMRNTPASSGAERLRRFADAHGLHFD